MPDNAWDFFDRRYQPLDGDWQDRIDDYNKYYAQLLAKDVRGAKPWGSQVNTRYTATQVRAHVSFLLAGLLPSEPWVQAKSTSPYRLHPDVEPLATEEYNRRLQELNYYVKLHDWLRTADIYGLGVMRMGWDGEGIALDAVNPSNVAWDPTAHNFEEAGYLFERYDTMTLQDVVLGYAKGRYGPRMGGVAGGAGRISESSTSPTDSSEEDAHEIRTGRTLPTPEVMDAAVTLHDLVTPTRIITVHYDSQTVLRDIENPYGRIHYYDLRTFPEVFQVAGYSIPELIEGTQDEMNTCRRQRSDVRSLAANPMIKVRRASGLNIYNLRSRPGMVIPVNNADDVTPFQFMDTGRPLLEEESLLRAEGDVLIGVMPHSRGERGQEMKATVANLLHTNVNTRFTTTIKVLQDYPMRRFFKDFVELCSNYDEALALLPPEWEWIRALAEQGWIRVVLQAEAHVGNPFAKIQLLMTLLQNGGQFMAPGGIGMIMTVILKLADVPDAEKIKQFIQLPPPQGQQQGPQAGAEQGQGVGLAGELARARAPGQAQLPAGVGAV